MNGVVERLELFPTLHFTTIYFTQNKIFILSHINYNDQNILVLFLRQNGKFTHLHNPFENDIIIMI